MFLAGILIVSLSSTCMSSSVHDFTGNSVLKQFNSSDETRRKIFIVNNKVANVILIFYIIGKESFYGLDVPSKSRWILISVFS